MEGSLARLRTQVWKWRRRRRLKNRLFNVYVSLSLVYSENGKGKTLFFTENKFYTVLKQICIFIRCNFIESVLVWMYTWVSHYRLILFYMTCVNLRQILLHQISFFARNISLQCWQLDQRFETSVALLEPDAVDRS